MRRYSLLLLVMLALIITGCGQTEPASAVVPTTTPGNSDRMAGTAVSAVYLTISNQSEKDVRLLSVSAERVGTAQIHQTIIENDIARMEQVEDGLLIAAGETVEFRPGGYHIMLMQLENDLIEGQGLSITLTFDFGSLTLEVPIAAVNPENALSVENSGVSVSSGWARPTRLADEDEQMRMENSDGITNIDMEATEESGNN